jgi:hypothetical protein
MQCNVGENDKIVRWAVGIIILAVGLLYRNWLGLIGIIPMLTAIFGYCGLYKLLGISTCKDHPVEKK